MTSDEQINPVSKGLLEEIEGRLGFVPPFFTPAIPQPELLVQLWRHTCSAYLDNPLPTLFKERLSAALGRYCAVRYCMMCHMCTLRPLGMQGADIVKLMTRATPNAADLAACIERVSTATGLGVTGAAAWPPDFDADVICISISIYRGDAMADLARNCLASALTAGDYNHLVSIVSYNHMCHDWVEAHPDISYELDQRFIENHEPLMRESPELPALINATMPDARRFEAENALLLSDIRRMEQISERRLQDVLRDLTSRLEVAKSDADRERGQFDELQKTATFAQEILAIVSHDLRNPLSAIVNSAHLLSRHADEKVVMAGGVVKRSAERAITLISDLLDFSQARLAGGIPTNPVEMNVHEILAEIVSAMARSDPGRTITLTTHGDGTGKWDRERLHQAIINLLANALKHSPPLSKVAISCISNITETTIEIANHNRAGAIPEHIRQHIFEPFKRFSAESTNPMRSVGLGLYIVNQIVGSHGGRIEVHSDAARTMFRVTLPGVRQPRRREEEWPPA